MNLYIFSQTCRGAVFGVGTYIRELVATLKDSDINVCVVNLLSEKHQIQTEQKDGMEYWHFPSIISDQRTIDDQKQWELYYRNVVYLLQLHIKDKKDLIFHLNFCENNKLIDELKNVFDCKIIVVTHFFRWGLAIYDNLHKLQNILKEEHTDDFGEKLQKSFEEEKACYLKVDYVICLTNFLKEIICQYYGLDTTKVCVIPNGLCDIVDNSISISKLRKKWNIQPEEKIILFAGRIDDVKGVVYLIRAFHEVLKKEKDCRLVIAGSGDYDKCFQESKNVCTKITFTGLLEKQELYELYRIADIGVIPSLFEPFGYVAVEMMMHQLPVVVTATSGLNEVVDDSCGLKTPLTVLPDSVEIDIMLLSEKILYLLQHPAEAKQMGQNGRKRYLENYSSKIFGDNMLRIYKSICL